jgi:hypothetical protein
MKLFAKVIAASPVAVTLCEPSENGHLILLSNGAFTHLSGYGAHEITGLNGCFLHHDCGAHPELAFLREEGFCAKPTLSIIPCQRKNHDTFWCIMPVQHVKGTTAYTVIAHREVSVQQHQPVALAAVQRELTREGKALAATLRRAMYQPVHRGPGLAEMPSLSEPDSAHSRLPSFFPRQPMVGQWLPRPKDTVVPFGGLTLITPRRS